MDKYAGYLCCGDCGKRLYLHWGKTIKPENNAFQCAGFQRRTTDCTAHYIRESVLDQIILHSLRSVTAFAREQPEEFYAKAAQNGEAEAKKLIREAEAEHEKRILELDSIIRCLYEDRVCGRISPERYDTMASGYEREQAELKLTPELLRVFILRIDVYEKVEKYSRTCGNPIVIHYVFQLPEQEGMPAIEKVMLPRKERSA